MRTMRIIPWRDLKTKVLGYTLVIEWWEDGKVKEDIRYQMNGREFKSLKKSVETAQS